MILGATPLSDNSAAGKDYYQSMIVAAVIAGVAILAFLVVTGVYLKRTTTYKAIISGDQGGKRRKATFANRAFKVCILKVKLLELSGSLWLRQPTMDLRFDLGISIYGISRCSWLI